MTNKYRCETCEAHLGVVESIPFNRKSSCELYNKMDTLPQPEAFAIWKAIEEVGCAIHSDFQSEREKVLETIDKIIDNEINYICENDDGIWSKCDAVDRIQKIWVKISVELREGKDGE